MTGPPAAPVAASLTGGFALLERAMGYTLGSLRMVRPNLMGRPTPCERWSLYGLLQHMNDSLLALHEAVASGHVGLRAVAGPGGPRDDFGDPTCDPVGALRSRACSLMGAWAGPGPQGVSIAGAHMPAGLVAATGAVEVAVHGWDVARSCGGSRPVPPGLADELLELVAVLVDDDDRPHRFAAPVPVPAGASPSDRLVGFLGRDPV